MRKSLFAKSEHFFIQLDVLLPLINQKVRPVMVMVAGHNPLGTVFLERTKMKEICTRALPWAIWCFLETFPGDSSPRD